LKDKRFLAAVYSLGLQRGRVTISDVAKELGCTAEEAEDAARLLSEKKLVAVEKEELGLTPSGRKKLRVVFIGGGFEIIHPGHLHTVKEAKKLGDVLVVVVARDSTIRRRKGREPVSSEAERVELLSSLRPVDAAILGVEDDIYRTLERVRPDVVALGYDQYHLESDIQTEGAKRKMSLSVVRLSSPIPTVKTSRLLKEY
jgi:FAD synthetase